MRTPQRKGKKQHAVVAEEESEFSEEEVVIGAITLSAVNSDERKNVFAKVKIQIPSRNNRKTATLEGKVDTAADVSSMPASWLPKLGLTKKDLQKPTLTLLSITGEPLEVTGSLKMDVMCNDKKSKEEIFFSNGTDFLISKSMSEKMDLVKFALTCYQRALVEQKQQAVTITPESAIDYKSLQKKWSKFLPLGKRTGDPLGDLKKIFPEAFDGGVGLFPGELKLKVMDNAEPKQCRARPVPDTVMDKLHEKLQEMEKEGIIRECPEITEWVHNLVITRKQNGDIRICLDPKNLNKYLVRNRYFTASWEDAQRSFNNGKFFSTLDAKSGYWTKKLSPESQLLTAFNTPWKKMCFVRMPFRLSTSAEEFSRELDQALSGIPGTFPCADDVKVQGSTEIHHDINLLETVEKARKAGLKFNPDKCTIKKTQIEFFGRIVTQKGVKPCPKKVEAIVNMEIPKNKEELESYIGTVKFMSDFIPNLTEKTFITRGLLKKNVQFNWTPEMNREFKTVKEAIKQTTELHHFDPKKPVIIETDASKKGLGTCLIQDDKPVRFASKSLTTAESNYSNIERELLAMLFAVEKFHIYTFGRTVTIHTDHEPLEPIFRKELSEVSPRLRRMLLRLTQYDLVVKYVTKKNVMVSDTLSRLITPGKDPKIHGIDLTIAMCRKINSTTVQSLQQATDEDPILQEVKKHILTGWPDRRDQVEPILHHFYHHRMQLSIVDGIVMKGLRTVIPLSMQEQVLEKLHQGHQGLSSTLNRARRSVYWPKMDVDIQAVIDKCEPCKVHAKKKPVIPEKQISATRALQILGLHHGIQERSSCSCHS